MKLIWLSHVLEESTPLYGGARNLDIKPHQSISSGDSCNTSLLTLPSHAGTHADAPYHFLSQGRTIDSYPPETWIFQSPEILNIPTEPGQLINFSGISNSIHKENSIDLLLIRTGFEKYRSQDIYWQEGPGLGPDLANHIIKLYPKLRAIGLDCISISSMQHREEGRVAHKILLEQGLLIFEDMSLPGVGENERLERVMAFPLRFINGDGAPCTIIGFKF